VKRPSSIVTGGTAGSVECGMLPRKVPVTRVSTTDSTTSSIVCVGPRYVCWSPPRAGLTW
jgi:hypothetical protein